MMLLSVKVMPHKISDLVQGLEVTEGRRYLLVGFVHVVGRRVDEDAYQDFLKGKGRLTQVGPL